MRKDLALINDFWDDMPALFERGKRALFSGLSSEFDKILNGKCDFEELEDKYLVELEVPGVQKDEINLSLKNEILTISWNRKREKKEEKTTRKSYERSEGSFTRSFNVDGAEPDKIQAALKDGVLKIVLPKSENSKAKKIEIK